MTMEPQPSPITLSEEGSAVDLALRGFNRREILEATGTDVGHKVRRLRSETAGIVRVDYAACHVIRRLGRQGVDRAVDRYIAGAAHLDVLQGLGLRSSEPHASSRLRAVFKAIGRNPKRERYAPLAVFNGLFEENSAADLACRGFDRAAVESLTGVDLGGNRSRARDQTRGIDRVKYSAAHVSERVSPTDIDKVLSQFSTGELKRDGLLDALGLGHSLPALRALFSALGEVDRFQRAEKGAMRERASRSVEQAHSAEANAKRAASNRARASVPELRARDAAKFRATVQSRYGVDNPLQHESIQAKIRETSRDRYGVDHHNQRPERRDLMRAAMTDERLALMQEAKDYSPEAKAAYGRRMSQWWAEPENADRALSVKRANGTWRDSQPERDLHQLLIEHFGTADVKAQYKDPDRYPWECDFYIPSRDLFIELNGFWTHGLHWFDTTDDDDQALLETWRKRDSDFYRNAVINWTHRDVQKRHSARDHQLNYAVFWGGQALDDAREWLEAGAPDRTDWK
ncbi:hypothetical protein [Brevibacterium sp. FME37]|uniref:DUF7487 domain-containing protein n=1 Tax=Brevibacterium sp. FME37 TaxID=2742607 RepID=UPI0018660129|nr:hypothetical protein [Brevibacterium sp. FME37]